MEQLLLVTSCELPAGIGASLGTDKWTNGQKDVTLEIVFYMHNILYDLLHFVWSSKKSVVTTLIYNNLMWHHCRKES